MKEKPQIRTFNVRIGNRLKEIRKEKKVRLITLAELSGVQLATISRIENNKMTGTLETHAQLAYALGVELVDLYRDISIQNSPIRILG